MITMGSEMIAFMRIANSKVFFARFARTNIFQWPLTKARHLYLNIQYKMLKDKSMLLCHSTFMKEYFMIYQETFWGGIYQIISDDSYRDGIKRPVVDVGRAFVRAIFSTIIYNLAGETIQFDIDEALKKCIQFLIKRSDQMVIEAKIEKLLMFLGEMLIFKKFDLLQSIEADFQIIISELQLHKLKELSLSSIIPNVKEENFSQDETLLQILEVFDDEQNLEPKISKKATKVCYDKQIIDYLSTIKRYRSQINFLSQIMKIPMPKFTSTNQRHYYQLKATLSFPCIYLNKTTLFFQSMSKNKYYEQALNQVCRKILYSIYRTVPELWKDFIAIKSRKAIVS